MTPLRFARRGALAWFGAGSLLLPNPASAGWDLSGEYGGELDSMGEEFGAGSLTGTQLDPDDPLDVLTESIRFRDETTRPSAVLRLRLEEAGRFPRLRAEARIKAHPERTRGEVDTSLELRQGAATWTLEDRLYGEGGTDATGGLLHLVEAGWRRSALPGGLGLRATLGHEVSRAERDSLSSIFDYQLFRPGLDLTRAGREISASLSGGTLHKRYVDPEESDYDGRWGRFRLDLGGVSRIGLEARVEARVQERPDSLRPSFQDLSFGVDATRRIGDRTRLRLDAEVQELQYAIDSSVYRDHVEWGSEVRLELDFPRPAGGARSIPADGGAGYVGSASPARSASGSAAGPGPEPAPGPSPGSGAGSGAEPPARSGSDSAAGALQGLDAALEELSFLEAALAPPDTTGGARSELGAGNGRNPPTAAGPALSALAELGPRWSIGFGARIEGTIGETVDANDSRAASGLVSITRDGGTGVWADLTLEAGRRVFTGSGAGAGLVFEGYEFSFSGTDHTFLEATLIGQFDLPGRVVLELFAQVEQELHDDEADDFRLWIVNLGVLRRF